MGRSPILVLVLAGCTAIRPLEAPGDAGERDAGDAGSSIADAGADAGPIDAGCMDGVELCNGIDDDCDPSTADGSADPNVGMPCDGADADQCAEGTFGACVAGALECSDATTDTTEVCGGGDENCDGATDEDGALGSGTWYPDADGDSWGDESMLRMACVQPIGGLRWVSRGRDCDDSDRQIHPNQGEDCNGVDDDCDGLIDNDSGCPCLVASYGGHAYSFCNPSGWNTADNTCTAMGAQLAIIDDAAENAFIVSTAMTRFTSPSAWIGLHRQLLAWEWVDGTPLGSYAPWDATEPDGTDQCAAVRLQSIFGAIGAWHDFGCGSNNGVICESF